MKAIKVAIMEFCQTGSAGKDVIYLAFEKVVGFILGFVVSILIVRHLGPQRFGIFSYVTGLVAVVAPLATLGLAGPIVKLFIHEPQNVGRAILMSMQLRFVAAFVSSLIVFGLMKSGFLFAHDANLDSDIFSVSAILVLQYFVQVLDVFESYNQANGRIALTTKARLVAFLMASALRVVAVYMGGGIVIFAWLVVLQPLLGFGLMVFWNSPVVYGNRTCFDGALAKKQLQMGVWVVGAGLLNMAQARAEMLILEHFSGLDAVGIYAAALRFVELSDTIGIIAVTVYLPRLLSSVRNEQIEDDKLIRVYRMALMLYLVCLPVVLLMAAIAWFMLSDKFVGIQWVVVSMAFRPLLALLGLTRGMSMLVENRLRYGVVCAATGLVAAIVSASILIPFFGIYGAVISGLLSYAVSNIAIDAVLNRRYFYALIRAASFK